MKKLIATLLILGALISGNKIYANGNTENPIERPAKNMQVSFENVNIGAELSVKDSNGQILFSESIQSDGTYDRKFDFSSLPPNDYHFEVDKRGFISIYPFTVNEENVVLHKDQKTAIVKPSLHLDKDLVKLMRNYDKKQSLKVEIYYEGQELVFKETITEDGMIGRIYDFSSSTSGEYLFLVDYEDRTFSEYVSINTLF